MPPSGGAPASARQLSVAEGIALGPPDYRLPQHPQVVRGESPPTEEVLPQELPGRSVALELAQEAGTNGKVGV